YGVHLTPAPASIVGSYRYLDDPCSKSSGSSDRDNHSIAGRLVVDLLGVSEHILAHMRENYTFGADFMQMLRKCRIIQMEFHLSVIEVTFNDKKVGVPRS